MPIQELHTYDLYCDAPGCLRTFNGYAGETLDKVIKESVGESWTEIVGNDGDHLYFCPECSREKK